MAGTCKDKNVFIFASCEPLKEYSVILTTSFNGMNLKISKTKQKQTKKKLISKISVYSNFKFSSYA